MQYIKFCLLWEKRDERRDIKGSYQGILSRDIDGILRDTICELIIIGKL